MTLNESLLTNTFNKSHEKFSTKSNDNSQLLAFIRTANRSVDNLNIIYDKYLRMATNNKILTSKLYNTSTCKGVMNLILKNLNLSRSQLEIYKMTCTDIKDNNRFGILISSTVAKSVFNKVRQPLENSNAPRVILDRNLILKYELTPHEVAYVIYDATNSLVGFVYELSNKIV